MTVETAFGMGLVLGSVLNAISVIVLLQYRKWKASRQQARFRELVERFHGKVNGVHYIAPPGLMGTPEEIEAKFREHWTGATKRRMLDAIEKAEYTRDFSFLVPYLPAEAARRVLAGNESPGESVCSDG